MKGFLEMDKLKFKKKYFSIPEAAKKLNVDESTIHQFLEMGQISPYFFVENIPIIVFFPMNVPGYQYEQYQLELILRGHGELKDTQEIYGIAGKKGFLVGVKDQNDSGFEKWIFCEEGAISWFDTLYTKLENEIKNFGLEKVKKSVVFNEIKKTIISEKHPDYIIFCLADIGDGFYTGLVNIDQYSVNQIIREKKHVTPSILMSYPVNADYDGWKAEKNPDYKPTNVEKNSDLTAFYTKYRTDEIVEKLKLYRENRAQENRTIHNLCISQPNIAEVPIISNSFAKTTGKELLWRGKKTDIVKRHKEIIKNLQTFLYPETYQQFQYMECYDDNFQIGYESIVLTFDQLFLIKSELSDLPSHSQVSTFAKMINKTEKDVLQYVQEGKLDVLVNIDRKKVSIGRINYQETEWKELEKEFDDCHYWMLDDENYGYIQELINHEKITPSNNPKERPKDHRTIFLKLSEKWAQKGYSAAFSLYMHILDEWESVTFDNLVIPRKSAVRFLSEHPNVSSSGRDSNSEIPLNDENLKAFQIGQKCCKNQQQRQTDATQVRTVVQTAALAAIRKIRGLCQDTSTEARFSITEIVKQMLNGKDTFKVFDGKFLRERQLRKIIADCPKLQPYLKDHYRRKNPKNK